MRYNIVEKEKKKTMSILWYVNITVFSTIRTHIKLIGVPNHTQITIYWPTKLSNCNILVWLRTRASCARTPPSTNRQRIITIAYAVTAVHEHLQWSTSERKKNPTKTTRTNDLQSLPGLGMHVPKTCPSPSRFGKYLIWSGFISIYVSELRFNRYVYTVSKSAKARASVQARSN